LAAPVGNGMQGPYRPAWCVTGRGVRIDRVHLDEGLRQSLGYTRKQFRQR
jgi:hypothetical protein